MVRDLRYRNTYHLLLLGPDHGLLSGRVCSPLRRWIHCRDQLECRRDPPHSQWSTSPPTDKISYLIFIPTATLVELNIGQIELESKGFRHGTQMLDHMGVFPFDGDRHEIGFRVFVVKKV